MAESSFVDPKVIELSKSFVNVVAFSETTHGEKEVFIGKDKVKLCNEFHTIPCSTHTEGAKSVGRFVTGNYTVPVTWLCDPSGKELIKAQGGLSSGELMKKMNEALVKVSGEKATLPMWQLARKTIEDGDAAFEKRDYKKALDCYEKVAKMRGSAFKKMSDEALERTNADGEKLLKDALAIENVDDKKKALKKLAEDFKPLACSVTAKKELDALK